MSVEELLTSLLNHLRSVFPEAQDYQLLNADTETVPAGSSLTLTFALEDPYTVIIKQFYVDNLPTSEYEWNIHGKTYHGNELSNLSKGLWFEQGERFTLKITNSGASPQDYDYLIEGWGRAKR